MSLYVLKFGGSSVATPARIRHVAGIVAKFIEAQHQVVVVTSAMQGVTNQLIELTKYFIASPSNREYDAVISTGEQVAAGLLASALISIGIPSVSMNAWQIPIKVSGPYSDAHILDVDGSRILGTLKQRRVPVVTGFQGISEHGDICTIGRGGSDATACAVAKFINADECLIYTDVDGVYTADPRIVLGAKKIDEISYDDMVELSTWGAKVLQTKSTLIAKDYNVKLKVLSSFSDFCIDAGTKVSDQTVHVLEGGITGVTSDLGYFAICSKGTHNFANSFKSFYSTGQGDLFYLVPKAIQSELSSGDQGAIVDNDIGVVTVVGDFGGNSSSRIYDVITESGFEVKGTIKSDRAFSIVTQFQQTVPLVNKLHEMFLRKI